MKRILFVLSLVSLAPALAYSQDCSKAPALMKHIYNPDRLEERKGCITVTGIVIMKLPLQGDGDFHFRLKLDPGQGSGLINSKNNAKHQKRFLIFEPICIGRVKQATAKAACKGFHQKITLPNKGDHVEVTGIHMLDKQHGWLEIHPVTKIEILAKE